MSPKDKNKLFSAYKKVGARIETKGRVTLKSKKDFAIFYTPGVGTISTHLAKNPQDARTYSVKRNSVAVVSDGTAVLGLGDIGPYGALPVMEGKALIFKQLAGIDAWPIVLDTKDPDKIVETVLAIAPSFGGINLEDIAAPQCFDIERRLIEQLDIPVMHDDQHGTAIVVLAGLINAMEVVDKDLNECIVVVNGVGAAGVAIMRLLKLHAPRIKILAVDSQGIIGKNRISLNSEKQALIEDGIIAAEDSGELADALTVADIFVGVSRAGVLSEAMVRSMKPQPVVFALANPVPEILPDLAKKAGAAVVATGRSDFPNQINNALVFPGVFRGALNAGVKKITDQMKIRAAIALARLVKKPTRDCIIPDVLDKRVVPAVARAIAKKA